jgi:hypothetical protein
MDSLHSSRQALAEAVRARNLIPVIGPEALLVGADDGRTLPFYDRVADELLRSHGADAAPLPGERSGSHWRLHRAVAQILAAGSVNGERLRRSVSAVLREQAARVTGSPLLDRLARLDAFDLVVTLTPDDLLADALKRAVGEDALVVGEYSPSADSSLPVDVPRARAGTRRLFYALGRCASGTRVAIHEEDALEYLYRFHEDGLKRAPNLLAELRQKDLLFIGCDLPDWLGRGFLRLANESRLSAAEKKMEFFGADMRDPALNGFLARFSPNSAVFPWSAEEVVAELEAIALPLAKAAPPRRAAPAPAGGPTAFVSYASQNAPAARRIAEQLQDCGFGDVWLDKRKLIAGDDWSDRIDEAIEACDFFVPVLSREGDQRREGVFWQEWRKASARALRVADAFVRPVGVDDVRPDRAGYDRIFNGFTREFAQLHLLHAPAGELAPDDRAQLRQRCERFHESHEARRG